MEDYLIELNSLFSQADKLEAHHQSKLLLLEIAKDRRFMHSFMTRFLENKKSLSRVRHHPIISVPIEHNELYTFTAHLWFPLPSEVPSTSHQSIHHHGTTLLTSVAPFGEGYESILFKKDWEMMPETREVQLQVDKYYKNHQYSIDFVDTYAPHIVFFPEKFSITYALWSKDKAYVGSKVKQNKFIQRFKTPLKWALQKTGINKKLGVVGTKDLDFELKHDKCYLMSDRVYGYSGGDNINFIQNILHALQKMNFQNGKTLAVMEQHFAEQGNNEIVNMIKKFSVGEYIEDVFFKQHILVDERVNIPKKFVLSYFGLKEKMVS